MKAIALLLLLVAYGLLVPGLNQPMLSVQGTVEKTRLVELGRELLTESKTTPGLMRNLAEMVVDSIDVSGTVSAFDKTQSICLLYTSPSPRDATLSRMPSSA